MGRRVSGCDRGARLGVRSVGASGPAAGNVHMIIERELLARVGARVLEDAAHVVAVPAAPQRHDAIAWAARGVQLAFDGPFSGWCELWAPREVTDLFAATMLGAGDPCADADELGIEALRETVNILCGHLLTELAGQDPVFDLGTPSVYERFTTPPECGSGAETWFRIDGHPLLLRAWLTHCATEAA